MVEWYTRCIQNALPQGVRVQVSPPAPLSEEKEKLAYLIGIALGDGNLSNPNGRATRLRISCDAKYAKLADEIAATIKFLLPKNSVGRAKKQGRCFDVSVYSNRLNEWMPWKVGGGPKALQKARVPVWIRENNDYTRHCLRGLIQTDGCIYTDRGYPMVCFTNNCKELADDVRDMMIQLGFKPSFMAVRVRTGTKYTARIARETERFIKVLDLYKA